ncbi:flavin reductase family protein [Pararhodobacter aggregans]|uniref:Flavin reductase family protein n=1 Tax=Pararhodobacter aggregans TaxID=404875 RepID=A0A2T7UM76_9RHOB|nr:flavin reductase family protein [Pararhodobacter aggregans]PTW99994.1 flavin reductase (DIM6/NTAB) family NADH-FMN oxidoreductase RutF [Pararhodobacter aggregans]PVE45749.1 flavin reductase family protein [Pararhodobacter aggregans]
MEIDPSTKTMAENYKIMTGLVVPRPIAWISTLNEAGSTNLSPFSAFTFCSHKPPMVAVSIGRKAGSVLKDSGNNILRTGEFVVNIVNSAALAVMHHSSAVVPPDVSEAEALNLQQLPSVTIAPPRIAVAPASLECRLHLAIPLGEERNMLIIGEVLRFHVRDDLVNNGKIETVALDPVARLGGPNYAGLGPVVRMPQAALDASGL